MNLKLCDLIFCHKSVASCFNVSGIFLALIALIYLCVIINPLHSPLFIIPLNNRGHKPKRKTKAKKNATESGMERPARPSISASLEQLEETMETANSLHTTISDANIIDLRPCMESWTKRTCRLD